jgi:4-amino-4-deoxy-L-arabinose transferase-like glycosyltransferase
MTIIVDVLYTLFIFLIIVAVGKKLFRLLKYKFSPSSEENFFSLGAGAIFLSYAVFVVGVCKALYKEVFYFIFFILFLASFPEIKETILSILAAVKNYKFKDLSKFEKFLIFIIFSVAAANFVFNYAPPTDLDELLYHLNYPKIYVQKHQISVDTDLDFPQFFPQTIQMLYTLGLLLRGEMVAKLINFFFGIIVLFCIYHFTKKFISDKVALLSSAVYYTMPLTTNMSGLVRANFAQAYFVLLSLWAFLLWIRNNYSPKNLFLVGFMCGASFAIKYQGISCVIVSFIIVLYYQFFTRRAHFSRITKEMSIFCIIVFLLWAPWIARNYFSTGNPFYPYRVFKTLPYDEMAMALSTSSASSLLNILKWFIYLPRELSYGSLVQGSGPIFLAFIPLLIFIKDVSKEIKLVLIFAIGSIIFTYLLFCKIAIHWMYFTPDYFLLAVVASYAIVKVREMSAKFMQNFITSAVIFSLLFPNCVFSYYFGLKRIPFFIGKQSKDEYLQKEYPEPSWNLIKFCNANLPPNAVILGITNLHCNPYYYRNKFFAARPSQLSLSDAKEILSFLKAKKIDYIIFYKYEYQPLGEGTFIHKNFPFLKFNWFKDKKIAEHLELIYQEPDIVYLYKVIH